MAEAVNTAYTRTCMLLRSPAVSGPTRHLLSVSGSALLLVLVGACTGRSGFEGTPSLSVAASVGGDAAVGDSRGTAAGDSHQADGAPGDVVAGDQDPGDSVAGDPVSGDSTAGDAVVGDAMSGDTTPGDTFSGDDDPGPAGALDGLFGVDGKVTVSVGVGTFDFVDAVALATDGAIVAAGSTGVTEFGDRDIVVARFLANGSLDATFGSGGRRTVAVTAGFDTVKSVAVASDGSLWLVGQVVSNRVGIARLTADGTLDATFAGGSVVLSFGADLPSVPRAAIVDGTGRLLAGGYVRSAGGETDLGLLRIWP